MSSRAKKTEKIFNSAANSKMVHEACLFVENTNGDFSFNVGYGGKDLDSPIILASITKLFTTTCILVLLERGQISLEDKLEQYFDKSTLKGLHVYKGEEFTGKITISDLLFQTSGLSDLFDDGDVSSRLNSIHDDKYYTFNDVVNGIKMTQGKFEPGTTGKAYYANINFDILSEILVNVMKLPLEAIYKQTIFDPLGLQSTYLPTSEHDFVPNVYYKNESLHRPNSVRAARGSGGCISTPREMMAFIKAFFNGKLFSKNIFDKLSIYKKLQVSKGPIYYGGGYMQIPLNNLTTMFMGKGELLGHSGSTGSFAFYYPHKDLFFVGDLNQMANPSLSIRLVMKLAMMI